MKIGVYVAHEDDSILGVGGTIVQHLKQGNEVYIAVFTDGRNSHKLVLRIEQNPSVWEVREKRAEEFKEALKFLGVPHENLYTFEIADGVGMLWPKEKEILERITEITKKERPDLIYFNHPDAHGDHRAVGEMVPKMLTNLDFKVDALRFFIWTKELAEGRPEVDASQVPDIPPHALKVDVREELLLKKQALHAMKSQVELWPYPDWQVQTAPILEKRFIDYFLRGEEVFVKL